MGVDTGKSHLLLLGNSRATVTIDNNYAESEDEQVLLGIAIDPNLTFENLINSISGICKKASQKLNALARIVKYMNMQKRRTVIKSSVTSQFCCCTLMWTSHKKRLNKKINYMHERVELFTYKDNTPKFQALLNIDHSV